MNKVKITMYQWEGQKFGLRINTPCRECDANVAILADMRRKEFYGKPVTIEFKAWLTHLWETLGFGGWHAPVVVVNNRLFSQGKTLDRRCLANAVFDMVYDKKKKGVGWNKCL